MSGSRTETLRHLYCEFLAHVVADEDLAVVEKFTAYLPADRGGGVSFRFGDRKEARVGFEPAVGRARLYHEGGSTDWPMDLQGQYKLGDMGSRVGDEPQLLSHGSAGEAAAWLLKDVKVKLGI